MASIETSIQLYDGTSAVLSNIANAVSRTTQRFDDMNDHFDDAFDEGGFNSAKSGFNAINILINKIENNIDQSTSSQQTFTEQVNRSAEAESELLNRLDRIDDEIKQANVQQDKFNDAIQNSHAHIAKAENGFKGWQKAIIVANQAIGLIKNTLGSLGVMDMSGAFGRIDTMNRFQKTVTIMTGDADLASAALARLKDTVVGTAYGLDVASKSTQGFMTRGMSIGAATDQVRIWADAVSFYGEGTNQQLESVVDAIGKMFSKGTVEADQLDRLFDAGIGAAEIYAKAMNRSVSAVKDDLSKGRISAANFISTVSQAMDAGISAGAAKDAGNTWATTFANVGAAITRGWASVITGLDDALAARGLHSSMEIVAEFGVRVEKVLNSIGSAMEGVVDAALKIYNVMSTVGGFIVDNWGMIAPIIWGIVAALAVYKGSLLLTAIAQGALTLAKTLAVPVYALATGATMAETAAQWKLNSAMYACPLVWIIILIIALVAIFYIAVAAVNKFAGTSWSATGMIAGAFLWLAALIGNVVIGAINGIIQNLWTMFVEPFIGIIEWVLNVANGGFDSFGGAVSNLIGQIISWFLSLGKVVTKIIDAIFGTNWTAGLSSLQDSVLSWGKNDSAITLDRNAPGIDNRFDYGDAWDTGYNFGKGADDKIKSVLDDASSFDVDKYNFDNAINDIGSTADNTGKMANGVKISDEDLKYLHDLAERETINRYTTRDIKIEMTNNNNINSDRDLDGIVDYLRDALEKDMSISAEGVG
jgi:tape measure domain-containing protein